ncbi:MAG TPA: hypothetical protein VN228_17925 [Pyrinomonadaceae bacterium]|nr:hypothetical protein [Pyrinomonadaceae bacterium]
MRRVLISALLLVLLPPDVAPAQRVSAADRAWRPFFSAFRAAVRRRDQAALRGMMARDFFYHGSGGDENGDEDTRDEAFEFWSEPRLGAWEAFGRVLAQGAVRNTAMREPGNRRPSRVAPPAANSRRAIETNRVDWYAVFEFRGGRWYCTVFNQCCD